MSIYNDSVYNWLQHYYCPRSPLLSPSPSNKPQTPSPWYPTRWPWCLSWLLQSPPFGCHIMSTFLEKCESLYQLEVVESQQVAFWQLSDFWFGLVAVGKFSSECIVAVANFVGGENCETSLSCVDVGSCWQFFWLNVFGLQQVMIGCCHNCCGIFWLKIGLLAKVGFGFNKGSLAALDHSFANGNIWAENLTPTVWSFLIFLKLKLQFNILVYTWVDDQGMYELMKISSDVHLIESKLEIWRH